MTYDEIAEFISKCRATRNGYVQWCDVERFTEENMEDVSPGGELNKFGYFVVGTTIGGNAIVVSADDSRVYFADHSAYSPNEIYFPDYSNSGEYIRLDVTPENVARSLFTLADTRAAFVELLSSGAVSAQIDRIG